MLLILSCQELIHVHHMSRYRENLRTVCVIYMCKLCFYMQVYLDRLKRIQTEFSADAFTLIGLNSANGNNDVSAESEFGAVSTFENMKAFAQQHELNFPYLWDSTQDVTCSFGAISTPTADLIDHEGILRYKGQIDNHPRHPLIDRGSRFFEKCDRSFISRTRNPSSTNRTDWYAINMV